MSWNDDDEMSEEEEEALAEINRSMARLRLVFQPGMTLEQMEGFMIQMLFMSCGYSPLMVEEEQ